MHLARKLCWLYFPLIAPALCSVLRAAGEEEPPWRFSFPAPREAAKVLAARDDFVRSLSPFDRSARLKKDREVTEEEYLAFVAAQVLPWEEADLRKLEEAGRSVAAKLSRWKLRLPGEVQVLKTTGAEEGGASYTRGREAIVLPPKVVGAPPREIEDTLVHELFHLLTKNDPALRTKLYQVVGFRTCPEIPFPEELRRRKITNPDAPRLDCSITLVTGGDAAEWTPVLLAEPGKYDPQRGGEFFEYLVLKYLRLEKEGDGWRPALKDGRPELVDQKDLPALEKKLGRNTGYVIHPEEVLASNFVLLVNGARGVPSPEVLEGMDRALESAAPPAKSR